MDGAVVFLGSIGALIAILVTVLVVYFVRARKAPTTIPVPELVKHDDIYEAHIQLVGGPRGKQTFGGSLPAKIALCEERYPVGSILQFGHHSFRVDAGKRQEFPDMLRDTRWVLSLTEVQ
jgi:hypothetical protein